MSSHEDQEEIIERRIEQDRRYHHVENEIEKLSQKIETLEASIKDLVEAWNSAGSVVKFVKYSAALITALAICWTAVKGFKF